MAAIHMKMPPVWRTRPAASQSGQCGTGRAQSASALTRRMPASAFLAHLEGRKDVSGTKVGTTGYCMGGAMSLAAAGTYPDRIAAAASFHGGNLATDSDLSPHHLASEMAARVDVAGADHHDSYPPEMAAWSSRPSAMPAWITVARFIPRRCTAGP